MTQIDHRTIIALSSVKGVGPVKLRKMISQIQDNNVHIETWEDLYDFLMEYAPTSVKVSDDLAEDAFRSDTVCQLYLFFRNNKISQC